MNVIIIEDEAPAARRLKRLLEGFEVQVSAELHSVAEALEWFNNHQDPDLIFLDIQLSDGLSFEIFEQVDVKSSIIFTTAYDEYALKAFKLNSIDYLLKPIDKEELEAAVEKYRGLAGKQQQLTLEFEDIKKLLVNPVVRDYKKRFTVKIGQHIKLIGTDEIECFYSQDKGTYAYTEESRNYLLEDTLETLEDELPPDRFFRVSRKHIVNVDAIKDIVAYTNSRLELKLRNFDEHQVIVSRDRVRDFKEWLS
ncbi:LytR/AlgR family response regulator transcription factor [Robertkochia aurantiaca]|uniref:LytR/AlgR family response regulator transcription factor n=1 Tax=Robertkochia aurantiaca TaxID=2873700 RepID=UPI001CCBFCBB|nr:LytTR family DNA-binding domain-containing protein [Robertkochia sp. 3YJGBD-33]